MQEMTSDGQSGTKNPRSTHARSFFSRRCLWRLRRARRRGPGGFQEQLCTDGVRRAVRQRSCQRGCGYFLRPRLQGITEKNFFPNHYIGHPVRILPILDASNAVLQACRGVVNIQSVSGTEQGRVQHLDAVPSCVRNALAGPRQFLQLRAGRRLLLLAWIPQYRASCRALLRAVSPHSLPVCC